MKKSLKDLKEKDLSGFKIEEYHEVYNTTEEGFYSSNIGFFKNKTAAAAFTKIENAKHNVATSPVLILTDGKENFLLEEDQKVKMPLNIFNDEQETLRLRGEILKKLSPEELKLLNITP